MSKKTANPYKTNEEYRSWALDAYKKFRAKNRIKCDCGVDHYIDEDVNLFIDANKQKPTEVENSNVPRS